MVRAEGHKAATRRRWARPQGDHGEKEFNVVTKFGGKQRIALASGDPERRPAPLHYAVVKDGVRGLEVLRVSLEGKGGVLPVFSAGWAAHGYLFAEAPGGGWYVRAYTPGDLISLLVTPCASVEWVALDPRPGPRSGGEAATVMPWENFVDYLVGLTRPFPASTGPLEAIEGGAAWARRRSEAEDRKPWGR
jgi:hypothetical protein